MSRPGTSQPTLLDIRFSRRLARECGPSAPRVPEWAVCDAVMNGTRRPAPGREAGLVLFERTYPVDGYPGGPGPFRGAVAVVGRLTRSGFHALRLLRPGRGGKKSGMIWDF